MTRPSAVSSITVRCPQCKVIIERITPETMVYCIACRKWCREDEETRPAVASPSTSLPRPRRRFRCH